MHKMTAAQLKKHKKAARLFHQTEYEYSNQKITIGQPIIASFPVDLNEQPPSKKAKIEGDYDNDVEEGNFDDMFLLGSNTKHADREVFESYVEIEKHTPLVNVFYNETEYFMMNLNQQNESKPTKEIQEQEDNYWNGIEEMKNKIEKKIPVTVSNNYAILVDLDQTLVATKMSESFLAKADPKQNEVVFEFELENRKIKFIASVRPYAIKLIESLSKKFTVVAYTASIRPYAEQLIKILDPTNKYLPESNLICANNKEEQSSKKTFKRFTEKFPNIPIENIVILEDNFSAWEPQCRKNILLSKKYYAKAELSVSDNIPFYINNKMFNPVESGIMEFKYSYVETIAHTTSNDKLYEHKSQLYNLEMFLNAISDTKITSPDTFISTVTKKRKVFEGITISLEHFLFSVSSIKDSENALCRVVESMALEMGAEVYHKGKEFFKPGVYFVFCFSSINTKVPSIKESSFCVSYEYIVDCYYNYKLMAVSSYLVKFRS